MLTRTAGFAFVAALLAGLNAEAGIITYGADYGIVWPDGETLSTGSNASVSVDTDEPGYVRIFAAWPGSGQVLAGLRANAGTTTQRPVNGRLLTVRSGSRGWLASMDANARALLYGPIELRDLTAWPGDEVQPAARFGSGRIRVEVATDRAVYWQGQEVAVSVTGYNPSDRDIRLSFNTTRQAAAVLDGTVTWPIWAGQAFTNRTIPANSSVTWSLGLAPGFADLGLGVHRIEGSVIGYGDSATQTFRVIDPPVPPEEMVIDFDTYPNGLPALTNAGYRVWGVHFSSIDRRGQPSRGTWDDGTRYAHANTCSYPTGFNIVAEFDMPIHSITADVGTAAGRTITMIARDDNGDILDQVTSQPIVDYREMTSLQLTTNAPIASVEWWPSEARAAVLLDNIHISVSPHAVAVPVPEPTALAILAVGAVAFARRKR